MSDDFRAWVPSAIYVERQGSEIVIEAHADRIIMWMHPMNAPMASALSRALASQDSGGEEIGDFSVFWREGMVNITYGLPPSTVALGPVEAGLLAARLGVLAAEAEEAEASHGDFGPLVEAIDRAWGEAHAAIGVARWLADSLPDSDPRKALALSVLSDIASAEVILAQANDMAGWRDDLCR